MTKKQPTITLYVRTEHVKKAKEIIERITGMPAYQNPDVAFNIGMSIEENGSDIEYSINVGLSCDKEKINETFLFFQIAGEIGKECSDAEIGFVTISDMVKASLWSSKSWKKQLVEASVKESNLKSAQQDKLNKIRNILDSLEEEND